MNTNANRSRVIVKNLPIYLDEAKLKKHFETKAPVTDVKLMRNREGTSRRFGFVGFKNEADAAVVVKYFNESFIDTARISVEIAKSFGDSTVAMPWKEKKRLADQKEAELKRKREQREEQRQAKKQRKAQNSIIDDKNEKLNEYLEVFDHRPNQQSWKNDDVIKDVNEVAAEKEEIPKQLIEAAEKDSDDEYEEVKAGEEGKPDDAEDEDEEMMPLSEMPKVEDDGLAADEEVSDMDWLRKRQKRMRETAEGETAEDETKPEGEAKSDEEKERRHPDRQPISEPIVPEKTEEEKVEEKIMQSGRLFLRNLLYTSTEEDFRELFSKYGDLEEVHVAVDTRTGKSKGFAYIQFKNPDDALSAYKDLDKQIFQGRLLHVLPANPKKDNRLDEFELKNLPLKKQNELKRKAAAAKQQFSWNTLYLNSDAIMDSVANRLGVKKSDLISPDSADGAVKQALAEASVIGNVRQYFESKGVDLLAFNNKEKSDKVILVKNFPYDTSVDEIANLFNEFGDLKKVLMPPDGGIAMVVFKHVPQARAAFTKLAYRRFKSSILYLEKGPKGLFDGDDDDETTAEDAEIDGGVPAKVKEIKLTSTDVLEAKPDTSEETDSTEGRASVFVKNLNFETTSQALTNAFKALDGFAVAQVKVKPNPKKAGSTLSMGFGFVEFTSKEAANVAIAAMDGYVLDGHKLQLKLSHRGTEAVSSNSAKKSSKKTSPKILIKNIPFEATKKDIQQLFGTFGQLRSVRLPKKFNKTARGFAFAEFITAKEAENAMSALQGTHLLGRRLVMEYAQADAGDAEEEIARMEKKVRKQVTNETLAGLRLSGKRTFDLEDNEELNGLDGR